MRTVPSIAVRAVSLAESGILVNGMVVTDLLSGSSVRVDVEAEIGQVSGLTTSDSGPMWRGSAVSISRLEAIRELVAEVVDVRAQDPELTSPNPRIPRTRFPWGVGEKLSDVVVTGPEALVIAAYLRSVGVRARCVDLDAALRIAADLELARAELADLEGKDKGKGEGKDIGVDRTGAELPNTEPTMWSVTRILSWSQRLVKKRRNGLILLIVGGILVSGAVASVISRGGEGSSSMAGPVTDQAAEEGGETFERKTAPAPTETSTMDPSASPWQEPQLRGSPVGGGGPRVVRAAIPVNAQAEGWTLYEATERREIWTSQDSGVRLLVAATPTPLYSQEELDATVLVALREDSRLKVTSFAPIDYEEENSGATTRWQIRFIDGHQVSVGCQYRLGSQELMNKRLAACDRFTASARVG